MTDEQFFATYPDRQCHIRKPIKNMAVDKQRAALIEDECEAQFRALGDHFKERRRILLWRVPYNNPFYDPRRPSILKVPFLLFADETVEDTDENLLPILDAIMGYARATETWH